MTIDWLKFLIPWQWNLVEYIDFAKFQESLYN